jgi:AcrR family transcriptional regulator
MSRQSSDPSQTKKRSYRLQARAERQEETRRRIAAATAELHQEVGPARTTIAEIARRAGVQRPTVYNNFPTERELFAACQAHFLTEHPPPDPRAALVRAEPPERLRGVLEAFYGWYRAAEAMVGNVQRDRRLLPELDALLAETSDRRIAALPAELTRGFAAETGAAVRTRATIGLALEFATWQRLAREGLSDAEAADLMVRAARASAR